MRKFFLFFILAAGLMSAQKSSQTPDIRRVWLNHNMSYRGTISDGKSIQPVTLNIFSSDLDLDHQQEYFVSGETRVKNMVSKFEGKIKVLKFKNGKKSGKITGEYDMAEKPDGKHTGVFTGKFTLKFHWDDKTEKISGEEMHFRGEWKNYDGDLTSKTEWNN